VTDILRRINNIEKLLKPEKEIGDCQDCGRHLCQQSRDCKTCPPRQYNFYNRVDNPDGTSHWNVNTGTDREYIDHEDPEIRRARTACQTCGYKNRVYTIDLGGELAGDYE
jgi:hypothetical protein